MSRDEPRYIFGIHETSEHEPGEKPMIEMGKHGWIVFTHEVHDDPTDLRGHDYRRWSEQGFGIIARLNNGYNGAGAIPRPDRYQAFAARCGNFVQGSSGCGIWIIGNEMNLPDERPGGPAKENQITPQMYAECFKLCRDAIHSRPGHESDKVIVGAVAPWNDETRYPGNENGDWLLYFRHILQLLRGQCDGIALHTYTHGADPALVFSRKTMDGAFTKYHYNFFAYRDFMQAIPTHMRYLPVYITETDQIVAWQNVNQGWVQNAYREIARWNDTPGNQQIRCLVLYRWPNLPNDIWGIKGKGKVLDDWREAMKNEYVWHPSPTYRATFQDDDFPSIVTAGHRFSGSVRVRNDSSMTWYASGDHPVRLGYHWLHEDKLVGTQDIRTPLPHDVHSGQEIELHNVVVAAPAQSGRYTLRLDMVHELVTWFQSKGSSPLRIRFTVQSTEQPLKPPINDVSDQLPTHETRHYPSRTLDQIRYLVIHHSAAPADVGPQRFAGYHVDKLGLPGIRYHFVIGDQGQIWQTNALTTVSKHVESVDASSIGICICGNLAHASPLPAQLESLSQLCAWLIRDLDLPPAPKAVRGRKAFATDETDPNYKWARMDPGDEWDGGARWGDTLLERISALLA
ncbi:MAG: N-acetylmuramoyl-L-alanine amidase [Anaerolineae bacterium]|nr:N-acetylmuramoyl-L-alanine amidase [Anaerolineae bacterium]